MEDKTMIHNLLITTKALANLSLYGSMESSTRQVTEEFRKSLNEYLELQNKIYFEMEKRGWFEITAVEQDKIDKVISKYKCAIEKV